MENDDQLQDILARVRSGDRAALDGLLKSCEEALLAHIRSRLGPQMRGRVEVEDILQETYLQAIRSIARFQGDAEGDLQGWLRAISENVIRKVARKKGTGETLELARETADTAASPSKALRREERFERLRGALGSLSEEHRQVVLLARIDGLPVQEIARRMDRSPGAVSMLLLRALRKIREELGETHSLRLPERSLRDREGNGGANER